MLIGLFDTLGIAQPFSTSRFTVVGKDKAPLADAYRQASVGVYVASAGSDGIKNFTEVTKANTSALVHTDGGASNGPTFTMPALTSGSSYIGALRVKATLTYNNGVSNVFGTFGSWLSLGNVGTFSTTNWGIYDTLGGTAAYGAAEFTLDFALVGNESVTRSFLFRCECNP